MRRNWCFSPGRGCSKALARAGPSEPVERSLQAVLLDTIALDVADMQGRCLGGVWPHALHVGLDDDAACVRLARVPVRLRALRPRAPPMDAGE
jgi:hypothetical protein